MELFGFGWLEVMIGMRKLFYEMIHGRFIFYLQLGQDIGRNFGWVSNQAKCVL